MPEPISIRIADLTHPKDEAAFITLLETYMNDPKGDTAKSTVSSDVVRKLRSYAHAMVFFAEHHLIPVGMAVCFTGFSTFRSEELINIHDLIVLPDYRRRGIGRALINEIEAHARHRRCCKMTLEVREDNPKAQGLYRSVGFGEEAVPMRFWVKYL